MLVAGLGTPAFAGQVVTLADLLAGQSIIFGDKEFTNFRNFQSGASGPLAAPIDPALIDVTAVSVGGEIGLEFSNLDIFNPQMAVSGAGPNQIDSGQGTVFEFDVIVLDPNLAIDDNTLELVSSNVGISTGGQPQIVGASVTVEERVLDNSQQEIAFKKVLSHTIQQDVNLVHEIFPPQSQITVNVDIGILLDANAVFGNAIIDTFRITFSQIQIENGDDGDGVVGGEFLPIETTSLILAGAQSFSWMIPVVLSVLGIGLFVVSRKKEC